MRLNGKYLDLELPDIDLMQGGFKNPLPNLSIFPRKISGVYLLLKKGKIVYVGHSADVRMRIQNHKNMDFDSFLFLQTDHEWERVIFEQVYISWFKPPENIVGNKELVVK